MQRIGADFVVKSSVMALKPGGVTLELYEMPNGQWQFGKGKDAKVITRIEEVSGFSVVNGEKVPDFHESIITRVQQWLERVKHQPTPAPMVEGAAKATPDTALKIVRAINAMAPEMQAKVLLAIESVVGPVADSLTQGELVNSHGDGFGQDQPIAAPARVPFRLPEGSRYVDPANPSNGYLTPTGRSDEKGHPEMMWRPTPDYLHIQGDKVEAVTDYDADRLARQPERERALESASHELVDELEQARASAPSPAEEMVGAGTKERRRRGR